MISGKESSLRAYHSHGKEIRSIQVAESCIKEIKDYFRAQKKQADKLHANFHKRNANQAKVNKKLVNNRSWTNDHKKHKFTLTQGYTGVSANDCHHRVHKHLAKGHHQWGDCCYNTRGRNVIGEYKGDNKMNDNKNIQSPIQTQGIMSQSKVIIAIVLGIAILTIIPIIVNKMQGGDNRNIIIKMIPPCQEILQHQVLPTVR